MIGSWGSMISSRRLSSQSGRIGAWRPRGIADCGMGWFLPGCGSVEATLPRAGRQCHGLIGAMLRLGTDKDWPRVFELSRCAASYNHQLQERCNVIKNTANLQQKLPLG